MVGILRFRVFLFVMVGLVAFLQLRGTAGDLRVTYRKHFRDPETVRQYLAANAVRKLQLGAGESNPEGWINSDIKPIGNSIYLDVTESFPFESGSIHYIFAEHLIEHVPWESGIKMLKECYRVLAPGGKLRLITPNLNRHVYVLQNPDDPRSKKYLAAHQRMFTWPTTPVAAAYDFNKNMREWGHVFLYDPATLRKSLELAGFTDIRVMSVHDETDPIFKLPEYRKRENLSPEWQDDVTFANGFIAMALEAYR